MSAGKFSTKIAWGVALLTTSMGIALLCGFFLPEAAPKAMRFTLGTVLVLMGVYRFLVTRMQVRKAEDRDE
jgi:uncharacterized membrane protein YphA (DoxX/SURF4 family)